MHNFKTGLGRKPMERREHLRLAAGLSILGLSLLALAAVLTVLSGGAASQERFDIYWDPAQYTAALREAGSYLRMVLAADNVFIVAYMGAIGFAALGFRAGNPPAALTAGLGVLVLGKLDFWVVTLVALTFTIPKERFFETLPVSATWLVLPVTNDRFVTGSYF
jgi:hypothetical protein